METIDNFVQFRHPCSILISGPSQIGKTHFVQKIIKNINFLFYPEIKSITWCSPLPLPFQQLPGVKYVNEIPDPESLDPNEPKLIIFDDWQNSQGSNLIAQYFTKYVHHTNTSVIHITQTIFNQTDKFHRIASLNANYLVLFPNHRDRMQMRSLGNQLFPSNGQFLQKVMDDVTAKDPRGYIVIDLKPETNKKIRLRSSIFPSDGFTIAYANPKS